MSYTTIKDIYERNGNFLEPFAENMTIEIRQYIPIIDKYILSNFYRVIVDEFTYNTFLPVFLTSHEKEFERVLSALEADYNPINNYDMTETVTMTKESEETTKEISHTGEKINNRTEIGTLETLSENSESVIDTDDMKLSTTSKTTTTPNNYGSENIESYNNYKITETISHTQPETGITTTARSGNIGVTTTQQMIQSTIELEKNNTFVQYVVFKFINELTTGVYNYD